MVVIGRATKIMIRGSAGSGLNQELKFSVQKNMLIVRRVEHKGATQAYHNWWSPQRAIFVIFRKNS